MLRPVKNLFVLMAMLTLLWDVSAENINYEQIEKNLKQYEQKLNTLQQTIDNSIFNDEEILISLDFEAENLITFLQDEFVFQPYTGLLRGVQGTLNSRSGNALDQAVLLAKLLADAGLESRIANGVLTEQQVKLLLTNLAKADIPPYIGEGAEFEKAIAAVSKNKNLSKHDWQKTETFSRYNETLKTLQQLFSDNNISLKKVDITKQLINNNKDYFWVQYRLGQSDDWSNAHPAFAKNNKIDVKAISYFKGKVPEKHLHQVKIEAFIQQRVGAEYNTHSLMSPWQKPAANLQDFLITYSNAPSGVNIISDYDLDVIVDKTTFFTPTFNGKAVGEKVFDLKGRLVDSTAMNSQMGGLFQTLGDKTLAAVDTLDGKKNDKSHLQLISQWLQFTFISPNGDEFVQKRYIYQAIDNIKQDEKTIKTQLLSQYSLWVNTGEQPIAYLGKVYLDLIENGLPLLKASTRKLFKNEKGTKFPKKIKQSEFELLTQYYWMDSNPNLPQDTLRFRASANMLGFKRGYINANTAYLAVDIIANKQQFINKNGDRFLTNPQAAFQHGIWETASEWLPSRLLGLQGNSIDTLKVTTAAKTQNLDLKIYQANNLSKEQLKQDFVNNTVVLNRIMSDIDQGYAIVTPSKKPVDLTMIGWWRINSITGETLGMVGNGGGSEITEYSIQMAQNVLFLVRALGNLKKCESIANDRLKLCCLMEAHINNVGGLAFGSALGATVGTAASAVFDIADFAVELATGTGIAPSTNGALCKNLKPTPNL